MRFYKDLLFWENRHRSKTLTNFINDLKKYFAKIDYSDYSRDIIDTEETKKIRTRITKAISKISKYCLQAGKSCSVTHTPPPAIGGYVQKIDLIQNIFNLHNYDISIQHLIDQLNQVVGVYEDDYAASLVRTINPFFYLFYILRKLVHSANKLLTRILEILKEIPLIQFLSKYLGL